MKKDNPLVSVIIPAYNEENLIDKCLESILKQSYPNFEVIVVDDGSTDQSKEIVKQFKVTLLTQNHLGPAKARNLAAKKAKGDILVLLDADMVFSSDFLKDLTAPILRGETKGTYSKEEYIGNWGNVWSRCWNYNQGRSDKRMISQDSKDGRDFRAILKSEFEKVGGYDDIGYTDTWSLSEKLGYNPQVAQRAIYYHMNPDNLIEVFTQSKWMAKRGYKLGLLGDVINLIRASIPVSLLVGIYKCIKYLELRFIIFKLVFDLGKFIGILEKLFKGKLSK